MSAPVPDPPPVLPWRGTTAHHRSGWPEGYWRKVVWRGLRLRCPVCGQGRLFRTYFTMHESCSCCGVRFAREQNATLHVLDSDHGLLDQIRAINHFFSYFLFTLDEMH